MLNIKRYVNNIPYEKNELYKNEISDEVVYKVINRVKNRVNDKSGAEKREK